MTATVIQSNHLRRAELRCDRCDRSIFHGQFGDGILRSRSEAKRTGWAYERVGRPEVRRMIDVCPQCQQEDE